MRRILSAVVVSVAVMVVTAAMYGQRRITPVGSPELIDPAKLPHLHDSLGNVVVVDTAALVTDSVAAVEMRKVSKMIYPLIY